MPKVLIPNPSGFPVGASYAGKDENANISSAELRNNMKKYLDLARAITVDDVIERVREGLTQMFERKEAGRSA